MDVKDIISEENARLLYKKGFDKPCLFWYNSIHILVWTSVENRLFKSNHNFRENEEYYKDGCCPVSAPTLQMAMRWLREACAIEISIACFELSSYRYDIYEINSSNFRRQFIEFNSNEFCSYEEACEAAIKYCLENLI